MPSPKRARTATSDSLLAKLSERPQFEFELDFYDGLLSRLPDYAEVLNAQAGNFAAAGRFAEGLKITERIVRLRPNDAAAHYALACRHAQLKQRDQALAALRRAIELGFRDVHALNKDKALAALRKDPRFRQLLRQIAGR